MKKFRNILALVLVFFMISCTEDFLDINENPNVPWESEVDQLMAYAQTTIAYMQSAGIAYILNVYTHQVTVREQPDQYGMTPSYGSVNYTWANFYSGVLPNLNAVIEAADDEELGFLYTNTAAAAKVLKVHSFTTLADLWGDVPFSEAIRNIEGIIHPKLDSSAEIYNACFALLDEAREAFDTGGNPVLGDLIYAGNVTAWMRAANTLELMMLNKSRLAKSDIPDWSQRMTRLMSAHNNPDVPGFIASNQPFEVFFTESTAPDQRHPQYGGAYIGSQLSTYISPWIYELMSGLSINATDNPFNGIPDPRRAYYWYRQLEPGSDPDNPWEYRHGTFVSIFFGSIGPNRDMSMTEHATTSGIYPVGGKFDAGEGGYLSGEGNGVAPGKIFTYADLLFTMLELSMQEGQDFGDETELFEAAILASFQHIDHVVNRGGQEDVPTLVGSEAADDFIEAASNRFEGADAERRFEIVMTQKWVSAFFNGIQNYNDYRRTGYPVLFDANAESITPEPTPDGDPIVPTQVTRSYPRTMWYPQREVELNPLMDQKGNLVDSKVFWDKL